MNRLLAGILRLGPTSLVVFWLTALGVLLTAGFSLHQLMTRTPTSNTSVYGDGSVATSGQIGDNIVTTVNNPLTYVQFFTDSTGRQLPRILEVTVQRHNIVDSSKGFIRFTVDKKYLNTEFNAPVTLKYKAGRYEPVALTFANHPIEGPGITLTSPEREQKKTMYLHVKFRGMGRIVETEDPVFEVYYTRAYIYWRTIQRAVRFEPPNYPPVVFSNNTWWEPLDENAAKATDPMREIKELEQYFLTHHRTD